MRRKRGERRKMSDRVNRNILMWLRYVKLMGEELVTIRVIST